MKGVLDLAGVVLSALGITAVVSGEEDASTDIDQDGRLTPLTSKGLEVAALSPKSW